MHTRFQSDDLLAEIEKVETMVSKVLDAPYKMASTKLLSAMNELLCQDYKRAYDTLNKVIDLAEKAFHYTAGKNLDKDSFRDITRVLRMAAAPCLPTSDAHNLEKGGEGSK